MAPTTDRQTFRETLAPLATKTQTKIPALNGRVEKACRLVLGGDVTLLDTTTAEVGSLTDPSRIYQIEQGVCTCKDYDRAPDHLCAHRLATGFYRKLQTLIPPGEVVQTPDTTAALPEAPASVNLKVLVHGYEVMVTLRDTDETVLFTRLAALLKRQDIRPLPQRPAPRQGQYRT